MKAFLNSAVMAAAIALSGPFAATPASATQFTTTVPGTGVTLPPEYPEAGGVAIVLTGANGNIYYQFSDPDGAFVGFQNRGTPRQFRGNPFTINDPIGLDCGFRSCTDYFGGSIARIDVRFSAFDGDTQVGGFDENRITLVMNGYDVGNWSGRQTEITNNGGTVSGGFANGFGNNTFNTGWFSSTNPALLQNILTTGQTTTQVRDQTPNDNYWDFTRGPRLSDEEIRTIAPGYELEKTRRGGDTTFLSVGQQITYDYVVGNIGSVRISNITVDDDKIGAVTCAPTTLDKTTAGSSTQPEQSICSAVYTVTQEDVDAGEITNIAVANGTPEFGQLGQLQAEVTLTGPALNPVLTLEKVASPDTFTTAGQTITFTLTASNDGNATLTDVVVTDPDIPGFTCNIGTLVPLSANNTVNSDSCTGTYTVTQTDVDNAAAGTQLVNTATARGRDPDNGLVVDTASETVTGPTSMPALEIVKSAQTATFDSVGDVLNFEIELTNNGNVTWPAAPAVSDPTADPVICPTGPVAPGQTILCTASYTVDQDDLDAGEVLNEATASITINGELVEESDTARVGATLNPSFTIEKSLASGPDPYSAIGDELTYSYLITNTGNVRLDAVDLSDDLVSVDCPATSIPAGGSMTCNSTADPYVIDQDDLDAGDVTNTATLNAETPGGTPLSPVQDQLTVNADQSPALTIEKNGALASTFATGQTINYTFEVTNAGNVTLDGPFTVNDNKITDPINCPAGPLAVGASLTCTGSYEITATDSANGFVSNVASVTDGTITSPTDDFSIGASGTPGLTLEKVGAPQTFGAAGETITYTYTITNSGTRDIDTAVTPITVEDDKIPFGDFTCGPPPILFASNSPSSPKSFTCTAPYTTIQDDVDAGEVTNTASAEVTIGGSDVASPEVSETVTAPITPAFTIAKDATEANYDAVNDTINYTFTITNLTQQTLASVVVNDPLLGGVICTVTDVGPLATDATCTASYSVTQADLDNGSVDNTVTATGTSPTGATTTATDTESVPFDPAAANPSLAIDKRASTASFTVAGDVISYVIDITNDGNLTLDDAVVTDPTLGLTCNLPPLAPGQTDSSCTGSYTITQDDVDNGSFTNAANVTAAGGAVDEDDAETATGPAADPDYTLTKTADANLAVAGETITYTIAVENTGNVSLDAVTITDSLLGGGFVCTIGTLLPGESDNSCTGTYVVQQSDVDAGTLSNTATVSVTPPSGVPEGTTDTLNIPAPTENASMTVNKAEAVATADGTYADGIAETFTFEVSNTGNVTLSNVVLTDNFFTPAFSCTLPDLAPGDSTTTCADTSPLQASYTPDQDDLDAGQITNTVTVTAETVQGTNLSETDSVTLTGPDQLPDVDISKSSPTADFDSVGDVLTYSYLVENTGNITLTEPITVDDDRTTVTCPSVGAGLAPGGTITCSASYTVTQADLDAGEVTNIATASVTQPVLPNATYPTGVANVTSDPDDVTVPAVNEPELSLTKSIAAGSATTFDAPGDVITFAFTVTNTGNLTTTDPITVDDTDIGVSFECSAAPLAPGASVTCTTEWTAEQEDIDAGSFENTATASSDFVTGTVTTPPSSATALAVQTPEMTVVKEFVRTIGVGFTSTSQAEYIYRVTNTGNQTIEGPINIEDNLIGTFECTPNDLAPTDPEITCTAIYDITTQDVTFGSVTNTAIGKSVTVDSPPTSETIPNNFDPSIEITKAADLASFSAVGEVITYTYTVTNTSPGEPGVGRPSITSDIVIEDDNIVDANGATLGQLDCFPTATVTELLPDQTVTCAQQGTYTVTQADLDAVKAGLPTGFVTNNAAGIIDLAQPVSSPPVQVTVPGTATPVLDVTKTVSAGNNPAEAGDVLEYTIRVTNTGNQTINGIVVEDPMLTGLTCDYSGLTAPDSLSPQIGATPAEFVDCVGEYTVTQDDIDAQSLENTATAEGTNPQGTPVTGTDTIPHPVDPADPEVTVAKTLTNPDVSSDFDSVGDTKTYQITVTNSGNVTLASTVVSDVLFPGQDCTIGALAPGDVDTSCTYDYVITQDDIDRGTIDNTVTATATDATPSGTVVDDTDALTINGPTREPSISVNKSADVSEFDADGDVITYTYSVVNTGNVTITTIPTLTDDKIPPAGISCALPGDGELSPGEFYLCTAPYTVDQDDVDDGGVTNLAEVEVVDPTDPGNTLSGSDTVTVPSVRTPDFTLAKTAPGFADVIAGETITYEYRVENTGNVTLTNVTLDDQHTSAAGTSGLSIDPSNVIATLDVGDVVTLTAEYVVTQADVDAGRALTNEVSATATPPVGVTAPPPLTDSLSIDVDDPDPSLEVVKTLVAPGSLTAGQSVDFTITVENTGNVTLDNITLDDTLSRADGSVIFPAPTPAFDGTDTGIAGKLDVGETWTYEFTHLLTQDDVDAGGLSNTVTATGEDPTGFEVDDVSNNSAGAGDTPTTLTIPPSPGVEGEKTITSSVTGLGERVVFEITATNTGNVTLTGVTVADNQLRRADGTPLSLASGPTFQSADAGSGAGTLQVGETATYRATYILTQDDIDAGGIDNRARVSGTDPNGTTVTDLTDDGDDLDGNTTNDRTVLEIAPDPSITLDKTLLSGGPTFDSVGDRLRYQFTVTNTGNITLTGTPVITDPLITDAGRTISCDPGPLAPGASLTCIGRYDVTQDDIDNGSVDNTASATFDGVTSPTDSTSTPAQQSPALETVKDAISITTGDPAPNDVSTSIDPEFFESGAVVTYRYTVTNTGNTSLTGPITVTDNLIAGPFSCDAVPAGGLAPGDSLECTATYTVKTSDVQVGAATNVASVTIGTVTSPDVQETVPTGANPAISVTKELIAVNDDTGTTSFDTLGDKLTYRFTVTNTGNAAFARDVDVIDALLAGPLTCYDQDADPTEPNLSVGASAQCEADIFVTQDQLDDGEVVNQAYALTLFGAGSDPVTSGTTTETVPADVDPQLELTKTAAPASFSGPGETITYTLVARNSGNQTLRNISVSDPLLPGLSCSIASLDPGDDVTCTETYLTTQDDVDNGSRANTATATAIDPRGNGVTTTDGVTIPGPAADPAFTLTKSADPTPFGAVGSGVLYTFTVENTGNVTLTDLTITDALMSPAFTCTVATLAVGETDDSCTMSYTVTQDDKDAGEIENTADATARAPDGTPTDATDTITTPSAPRTPLLKAIKTADAPSTARGETVTYTLTLRNLGDVTLDIDAINDRMTRRNFVATPTALTTPFSGPNGDRDGDGRLDVTEVWTYTATKVISQADIDAGGFDNTVTVTARDPDGGDASDVSDDGDNGDGNTDDDPTEFEIVPGPMIEAVKTITQTGSAAGDEVIFEVLVRNTGNVTLTNVTLTDTLTRSDDAATVLTVDPPVIVNPASVPTTFAPGTSLTYEVRYVLLQEDVDAGGIENTILAEGTAPDGTPTRDVSDNGDDTDGNLRDDPTLLTITPDPMLDAVKTLVERDDPDAPIEAGEVVTFTVSLSNTGTVTLSNLGFTDTLTNGAGDVLTPDSITFTDGVDETTLSPGDTNTYAVAYTLTQDDVDSGSLENTVLAEAETPAGEPVTDISDDGDDSDGNAEDDPTVFVIDQVSAMEAVKMAETPELVEGSIYRVTFNMEITNVGNITQHNVQVFDDLTAFVAPGELVSTTRPTGAGWTGTGQTNAGFNGDTDTAMLASGVDLAPGAVGTLQITVTYDTATGFPAQPNVITVASDELEEDLEADVMIEQVAAPDIFASKSVAPEEALLGATVTYTLQFENRLGQPEAGLSVIDDMPVGVVFTPGTVELDGDAYDDPQMTGRQLRWDGIAFDPFGTVTITFDARVVGEMGEMVNRTYVLDDNGDVVSNVATAVLVRRPEPVFDCGDVIGKVFDDRNMNGYQDGVIEPDRAAITDQTYRGGKFGAAPEVVTPDHEPGLPNVRLSTVTGTLITTDAYGRFSVPCAELPAAIGSNFTLKLDERTLPTGYVVTTENPRVVRLTPGTVAKMNFGAAIANVIDIDLMGAAFVGDAPSGALVSGVEQLARQLADQPTVLKLTYVLNGESRAVARARLLAVEALMQDRWRGSTTLRVERTIRVLQ